jgi:hypothetical protein
MRNMTSSPQESRTRNDAVPTPWIGKLPATPTTMIAQARRMENASTQEHMHCPAPESMKNLTSHSNFSPQVRDSNPHCLVFFGEGKRSFGTLLG